MSVRKPKCLQVVDYHRNHICGKPATSGVETLCEGGHLLVTGPRCDRHVYLLKGAVGGPCRICRKRITVTAAPIGVTV